MVVEIALLGEERVELSYSGYARMKCHLMLAVVESRIGAQNQNRIEFPTNPGPETIVAAGFEIFSPELPSVPGWFKKPFRIPPNMGFVFEPGNLKLSFLKEPDEPPVVAVARLGDALSGILSEEPQAMPIMTPDEMIRATAIAFTEASIERSRQEGRCFGCGCGLKTSEAHQDWCTLAQYAALRGKL